MINIEINPKDAQPIFIENLNLCFPNWGDEKHFNYYFERKVNTYPPELILFRNADDEVIAGSGVSYRDISLDGHTIQQIGIMTGSWTLPKSRGMGCFTKMIETSKQLCKAKDVPLLTAFVTEDNASYRRLRDAGSTCVPANNYFFENEIEENFDNFEVISFDLKNTENLKKLRDAYYKKRIGFTYTVSQFKSQFIDRIFPVEAYTYKGRYYIVEHANITKLLFVSQIDANEVFEFFKWLKYKFKKNVMLFSTDKAFIKNYGMKLNSKDGFFTMLPTDKPMSISEFASMETDSVFQIQLGDKV